MSLRARFALTIAALVAVAVGLASTFAWVSTRTELRDELDQSLAERVGPIVRIIEAPRLDRRPPAVDLGRRGLVGAPDTVYVVLDDGGAVVASVEGDPLLPVSDATLALAGSGRRGTIALSDVTVDGDAWRLAVAPLSDGGAVLVARDLGEVEQVLAGLRRRLVVIGLLSTIAAALAGWLLARRETAPLERLTAAAEHVAATRDLTTPIEVVGRDEVGRLATSFDTMLGALATSLEQQRRLIEDAGHELRTPLTSLRTNIDVLRQLDRLSEEDRVRLLDDVGAELGELSDLVGELVALAGEPQADQGAPGPVRLDDLVGAAAQRLTRRTGRVVTVDATPTTVVGVAPQLDRAITNLLANADKFSAAGTSVQVIVGGGRVEVRDHGPGIAPADRPHVFERFYRAEGARGAPGSGLGLSIVAQLVTAHGGAVHVGDAPEGGAAVGFTLPEALTPDEPSSGG